jgi:Nuclease-related domain
MRVLRTGGEFTAMQMWKQRLGIVLGFAAGLAIAAASALLWRPAGMLLGLVPAVAIARPCYRRLIRFQNGAVGEQSVAELLAYLPDDYVLLNDLVLPGHPGNIDHVLIGPCGVVVIETKRWAGTVVGDRWSVNGYARRNVTRQVTGGAIAVKKCLARGGGGTSGWVESVVFTHPLCRLVLDRPAPTVARFSELMNYLATMRSRPPKLTSHSVRSLAQILLDATPSGKGLHPLSRPWTLLDRGHQRRT